ADIINAQLEKELIVSFGEAELKRPAETDGARNIEHVVQIGRIDGGVARLGLEDVIDNSCTKVESTGSCSQNVNSRLLIGIGIEVERIRVKISAILVSTKEVETEHDGRLSARNNECLQKRV